MALMDEPRNLHYRYRNFVVKWSRINTVASITNNVLDGIFIPRDGYKFMHTNNFQLFLSWQKPMKVRC